MAQSNRFTASATTPRITLRISHPDGNGPIEGFRYFWAFVATGYDSNKHCQPGLRGKVAASLNSTNAATGSFEFVVPEGRLLYVCGVASGPKKELGTKNFHLPLVFSPGSHGSQQTYNGYTVEWRDGTLLPIPEVRVRPDLPESHYRCKNFRVAEAFFGGKAHSMR